MPIIGYLACGLDNAAIWYIIPGSSLSQASQSQTVGSASLGQMGQILVQRSESLDGALDAEVPVMQRQRPLKKFSGAYSFGARKLLGPKSPAMPFFD